MPCCQCQFHIKGYQALSGSLNFAIKFMYLDRTDVLTWNVASLSMIADFNCYGIIVSFMILISSN